MRNVTNAQPAAKPAPFALTAGINPAARQPSSALENHGTPPLTFEANHGQTDTSVDFIARTDAGMVFLTPTTLVMALPGQRSEVRDQSSEIGSQASVFETQHSALATQHSRSGVAVHMQILGANPDAQPTAFNCQPGIVNYFVGNDPNQWHANIPTFGGVQYDDVYPGIDLVYYGNQSRDREGAALEYDFIVSPGADPNQITLNFAGAESVEIGPQGDLVVHTAAGDIVQQKPYLYQDINGIRQQVAGSFSLSTQHLALSTVESTRHPALVRFDVGTYDPARPLVIDPLVLGYSTFIGGSNFEGGRGIAVDGPGNAYVAGYTDSSNFPATPGVFDTTYNGEDVFVAKLKPGGAGLAFATFLGGSSRDSGLGIAVDGGGSAYVIGFTLSSNFPTTPGAFSTTYNGGSDPDAFVTKLRADGAGLLYSTFLGGSGWDEAHSIAVDGGGSAYVTGNVSSSDFPTTPGAFDATFSGGNADAFVSRLTADGASLLSSTYLGGAGTDDGFSIALDGSGNSYVTGRTNSSDFPTTPGAFDTTHNGNRDVFMTKVTASGSALVYSTFLGGSGDFDFGHDVAVDGSGSAYVTGRTDSSDFPATSGTFDMTYNGNRDGFVAKLRADGAGLLYSTFLGGLAGDEGNAIAVDGSGNAYVTGLTLGDFPTTPGALDTTFNGGNADAIMTKLRADGAGLLYSTFLGGSGQDEANAIAVDGNGNAYVTGLTSSSNFPTTPGAFNTTHNGFVDAFVTKFCERACRIPVVVKERVP